MVKVEKTVVYIHGNHKHRLYKTKRAPTRYYYTVNNKRVYVEDKGLTDDMKQLITY
jgi:hypothetical protein